MFSSLISSSSSDPAGARTSAAPSAAGPAAVPGAPQPAIAMPMAPLNVEPMPDVFPLFRDVTCPVEVILGTGKLSLRNCLALERGSVVRLNQSAGEDLQIAVNSIRIAHGEVIIIDETIAVRITQLASPTGRERRA
jgi:flagellar motor switch protein FliN